MRPDKGLYIDTRPTEQPEGTYPYGKNGIQSDLLSSIINEPGFKKLAAKAPYKIMGAIETDSKPIVFSTDNTNSAVGYLNTVTEQYEPIIDDRTWEVYDNEARTIRSKIGFKLENYITGQSQRNYKGEMVIVFTDKVLFPMYLNCDVPAIKSVNDLRLFAFFTTPNIDVVMESGGSLPAGAYYIALGYERNDGTSTPYTGVSNVTLVTSGTIQGTNDKILRITISDVDTNYNSARIAIVSKVNGEVRVVELVDFVPITGNTLEFTYTGTELTTDIDISSVLTPPALYNTVGTIGQLNDYLYIAVLGAEKDLDDMQQYANLVHMEWISELIDGVNPPNEHITGKKKSLKHEEVYAFYIRYKKKRGGKTKWFVIAGPNSTTVETSSSNEALLGGFNNGTISRFKVEDTIPYYDIPSKSGGFGVWLNETEKYPDMPEFDSTSIGGPNLRNQLVRHHKTPSHRWCFKTFYPTDATYGKSKLDLLGFRALNVKIPEKYIDVIDGYEIGYAIRTVGNMTNYGQGLLLHGTTDHHADGKATDQVPIYSSGGNYVTSIYHHADGKYDNNNELGTVRKDTFRIHPFDVLFNKPSIQPDFISSQWKLRHNNLNGELFFMRGQLTGQGPNTGPECYLIDYTDGEKANITPSGSYLRSITKSFYTTGINVENFIGYRHETAFCGYLSQTAGSFFNITTDGAGHEPYDNGTESGRGLKFEEGLIVNLISNKADLYQAFYSQQITSAGDTILLTDNTILWGGDCFISPYTFHTYGRYNSIDQDGSGIRGFKVARRIICESVSNINLRYQIPGNLYSNYWPTSPLLYGDITDYLVNLDRSLDPNQFGYSKDFNALNDLTDSTIWSPFEEYIYDHPYRIHRGGKSLRTGRPRSWRTFLSLDYYEMQKNMGGITKVEGMDDRLIIHCENAMFLTQDKSRLQTSSGLIPITLGAGDIFQFEPQEAISSKLGYAGTQHDLACVRTPFGYLFVDAKMGEIYLYKGKLSLINEGIHTFLREFLKMPDKNNFIGNGITIGWDNKYKRILLTVKNKKLPDGTTITPYQDTPDFWNTLQQGQIVLYQNRYIKYVGLNNSSYQCPPDPIVHITTWQPVDQVCLTDVDGKNTGIMSYLNRIRLIDGIADGYKEPNTVQGLGTYFPPVTNITVCPLPAPNITWKGSDGYCLKDDVLTCPVGYELQSIGCVRTQTQPATPPSGGSGTPGIADKVNSNQWNNGGARVFNPGFDNTGNGTNQVLTTPHFWVNGTSQFNQSTRNTVDSRMNVAGIWVQGGHNGNEWVPQNEYIGFSRKITVTTARTVYVMLCADNDFKVAINGALLIDTHPNNGNIGGGPNFSFANIYPVPLRAGDNYIEMYAMNAGSVAGFAAEIYDVSLPQLLSATNEAQLNIIFSTKDMVGQPFDLGITVGYSCPDGWSLDTSNYTCVKTDVIDPTTESGEINNGMMAFNSRCRYINDIDDNYCEPNTNDGTGEGIYVPPVISDACLPIEPPTPGTVVIEGTFTIVCNDLNCTQDTGPSMNFTFINPTPLRFKLLLAKIIKANNTVLQYVGNDIIDPIPDGAIKDPYYDPTTVNKPFFIDVPAGVTSLRVNYTLYQDDLGNVNHSDFVCNNCNKPITDMYFKYDDSEQPESDTNTYEISLTCTNNANITVHNVI